MIAEHCQEHCVPSEKRWPSPFSCMMLIDSYRDRNYASVGRQTIETFTMRLGNRKTPVVEEAIERAMGVQEQYGMIAYAAGALTEATEQDKQRYELTVAKAAEITGGKLFVYAPHIFGTDPVKHPNVSPEEVRDIDALWSTVMAHCHFNFMSPVAHGNGIEAGWAEDADIPAIFFCPNDQRLSRLPRGLRNLDRIITYTNWSEMEEQLVALLVEMTEWWNFHEYAFREPYGWSKPPIYGLFARNAFLQSRIPEGVLLMNAP